MRALAAAASWDESADACPSRRELYSLRCSALPTQADRRSATRREPRAAARRIEASYRRPYQMHGSIGPSCAVALFEDGALTVWTHSQGVYPLREAIAEMLGCRPRSVRCIHIEGSGCYGHNGADDAAADAALIADALSRAAGARAMDARAGARLGALRPGDGDRRVQGALDAGRQHRRLGVRGVEQHAHRRGPAAAGAAARRRGTSQTPFAPPPPKPIPQPEGGGDRNAIPLYRVRRTRGVHPLRSGRCRCASRRCARSAPTQRLLDRELHGRAGAAAARPTRSSSGCAISTMRARATSSRSRPSASAGRADAKRRGAAAAASPSPATRTSPPICAVAVEVEVDRETGRVRLVRAVAAVDSGEAVNPDGIRNQIEGGILQSVSWTLYEAVAFDRTRDHQPRLEHAIRSCASPRCPTASTSHVIDRPGQPFLGTGEAAQGPTAAAIANAVADCDRRAHPRAAADARARQGGDRRLVKGAVLRVHPWDHHLGQIGRAGPGAELSAVVKGFGCRPVTKGAAHAGAGVRKPPGKEPARSEQRRCRRRYGD